MRRSLFLPACAWLAVACSGRAASSGPAGGNAGTSSPSVAATAGAAGTRTAGTSGGARAGTGTGGSAPAPKSDAGRANGGAGDAGRVPNDASRPPDASKADSGGARDAGASMCPGAKPDATNTGVPAGTQLTLVNQDVSVTQDDTIIDAQDIHGFLTIKASRVKVLRSIVRGHATSATTAIIRIDSGSDILLEDTEVAAAEPSVDVDGVSGSNFTARRLHIHGGVDGMKLGSNSVVECSFIHELASFASDPNQNGGATHNDAIQILSGTGIAIRGNQLVAAKDQNAAIQITQDFGKVGDVHISANWADGGGCTFNIAHKGQASLSDVFVTDNRFGRNSFYDCPILKSTQTTLTMSGNVWDDDGTAVPVQTHD